MFRQSICHRFGSFPPFGVHTVFCLFLYFFLLRICTWSIYIFIYLFIYIIFVFPVFHFFSISVDRVCWRLYVVPVIAQHTTSNGMALYYLLLLSTPLLPVSWFCNLRTWMSRTKNQRGHWVCWMSTRRSNSLTWSTHIQQHLPLEKTPRAPVSSFFARSIYRSTISSKYQWKKCFLGLCTSSSVNHMEIPCWQVCAKFRDHTRRGDNKWTTSDQPLDF